MPHTRERMVPSDIRARAFAMHRTYARTASALSLFVWIIFFLWMWTYLHDTREAFVRMCLLYALSQVSALVLTPYASSRLARGVRCTMANGILCASAAFAFVGLLALVGPSSPATALWAMVAVLLGAHRAFYYVPYMLESSTFPLGLSTGLPILVAPFFFGLALMYSIPLACVAASALLLISGIPLLRIPESYERYAWGYRESFSKLLDPRFAGFIDTSLTQGIEAMALYMLWPFVIFFVLGGSFFWLGGILSISFILAMLVRSAISRPLRTMSPWVHGLAGGSAWILRLAVATPVGMVLTQWYAIVVSPHPHDIYDGAADNSTYIDEFSALKEMSRAAGRLSLALITALAAGLIGIPFAIMIAFVVAGTAAFYSAHVLRSE